jgi:predicted kinase
MKICLILRGAPGAGKSSFSDLFPGYIVCSADKFFIQEGGRYVFQPTRLEWAHDKCKDVFQQAINNNQNVIVDNTNIDPYNFEWYKETAEMNGYRVYIVILENRHNGASVHNVPMNKVNKMRNDLWNNLLL